MIEAAQRSDSAAGKARPLQSVVRQHSQKWYVTLTLLDLLRHEYQTAKYITPLNVSLAPCAIMASFAAEGSPAINGRIAATAW